MRTVLVASTVVLAACATTTDEPSAVAGWRAPADYEFVLDSSCGERNFLGRYHIVVQDGEVTGVTGLDDYAKRMLTSEEYRASVPALSAVLEEARVAQAEGADVAEVAFDEADGHPVAVEIDWDANATDDEACYRVSQYDVAGNSQ